VRKNARVLGIRSWWAIATNREEWRKLLKEDKTLWVVVPLMLITTKRYTISNK
jgi:hypothetical protein